jgi:hypothetical protein
MSSRENPDNVLSSRFARLALVSLTPLLAIVVLAKVTANSIRSDTTAAPGNREDLMRIAVVGAAAIFMVVRLWLMTARSAPVHVAPRRPDDERYPELFLLDAESAEANERAGHITDESVVTNR